MTINRLTYKVPGFSRNPIEIMYRVPSGVQESVRTMMNFQFRYLQCLLPLLFLLLLR
jgi:hypothetical protein